MSFLLSLKVYSDFQRKENNTPCKRNHQSGRKSDGPVLPRFPVTAVCINRCYFLSMFCPAPSLPGEARGRHTAERVGPPRDPPDPTSAGYSLPSRSTGVAPSQTPANSSSPFQCLYASIPSPSPQFTEWSLLSFTGKHWRPFHTAWQNFPLWQFIMRLSSTFSQRKKYPFSFPSLVLCLCCESSLGRRSKWSKFLSLSIFPPLLSDSSLP